MIGDMTVRELIAKLVSSQDLEANVSLCTIIVDRKLPKSHKEFTTYMAADVARKLSIGEIIQISGDWEVLEIGNSESYYSGFRTPTKTHSAQLFQHLSIVPVRLGHPRKSIRITYP